MCGNRSFNAVGPRAWNDSPEVLREPGLSLHTFTEHLSVLYIVRLWFFNVPVINQLTGIYLQHNINDNTDFVC